MLKYWRGAWSYLCGDLI